MSKNTMLGLLRDFINALACELSNLFIFNSPPDIEIQQEGDSRLVLKSGQKQFIINKRLSTVMSRNRVLARFDAIETIDIVHHYSSEGSRENWAIRLNLKGWFSSVYIGITYDAVDASIVAARISAWTGKNVRSL